LYYYYNKKKSRENYVTSGHMTDITSGYDVNSGYDVTSGSTEQQSNDEESYYILKTNNPFFCFSFENLYTVFYVI
jgi:hypothetical protein